MGFDDRDYFFDEDYDFGSGRGRKPNQKLKPYIVMRYLMENSDREHPINADNIALELLEKYGIDAEKKSIYSDIAQINKACVMLEDGIDVDEAEEVLKESPERKKIMRTRYGYYANQSEEDVKEYSLIYECINSNRFISKRQADKLSEKVFQSVSTTQAEKIKHDSYVINRITTLNENTLNNISIIKYAMEKEWYGEKHEPEQITFNYLTHEVKDLKTPVERRRKYQVSPYQLLINDGYYYLLAYDNKYQDIRTYRVDRMAKISYTGIAREGEKEFKDLDIDTYSQRVFSMFGGNRERVEIRCINNLLDTMIDKFGTEYATYIQTEKDHFTVFVIVEVSDQFFSWICGLGIKVKIITPDVAERYLKYLERISSFYETEE